MAAGKWSNPLQLPGIYCKIKKKEGWHEKFFLAAGEVSYSQLYSLLPFDNTITLCSIRGRDLISKFLETDNPAYHIAATDHAKNIDPDGTYYVVTDTCSANYAYNNLTVIDTYAEDIFARDLLADHIAAGNLG